MARHRSGTTVAITLAFFWVSWVYAKSFDRL